MFDELMNERLIIQRATTPNKYAEYGIISTDIKCRLEWVEKNFKNELGEISTSSGVIYSKNELRKNDKLIYDGVEYKLASVKHLKDISGQFQHYVAYLI